MSKEIAVKVEGVSKTFKLPHEKQKSLKSTFLNSFRRRDYEIQNALTDINFEVKKGEFVGIVGRNGSGKSTLLKCIAGVYTPTSGHIKINGSLVPFIELGVGFNPELSGRDNVFLNGALLGFSRQEMEAKYDEIVDFSEIEEFMDQKLSNYSSGMQVRLAFSIAIQAKGDILLLDEVLAVGDAAFQKKCYNYFNELKENKQTVIFVSHDLESVRRYCDRAIVIETGSQIHNGPVDEALELYSDKITQQIQKQIKHSEYSESILSERITNKAKIINARVKTKKGAVKSHINKEDFTIMFDVKFLEEAINPNPGVIIFNKNGLQVCSANAEWAKNKTGRYKKGEKATFIFKFKNILEPGRYKAMANVFYEDGERMYAWESNLTDFKCIKETRTGNVLQIPYEFSVTKGSKNQ